MTVRPRVKEPAAPLVAGGLARARVPPGVIPWVATASILAVLVGIGGGWLLRGPTPPTAPPISVTAPSAIVKPEAEQPSRSVALPRTATAPPAIAPETTPAPASERVGSAAPAVVPPDARSAPVAPAAPDHAGFTITVASEQQILDHVPANGAPDPMVFRFAPAPRILVLDFASLREQGLMLNRVAAFAEKNGLPHDHLLSDSELDAAIRASGDTVETYYYGHDYGAATLLRFFSIADRDDVRLTSEETTLRALMRQEDWFAPGANVALISIPQADANGRVTAAARRTILHHELSHGEYFTNPAYVAFVHRFWAQTLTAGERERFRQYLRTEGYDPGLEEVMENEAQAYLIFTDGAEFFAPRMIGMSQARLAGLRAGFYQAMPAGWLRDSLGRVLSASKTVAAAHP